MSVIGSVRNFALVAAFAMCVPALASPSPTSQPLPRGLQSVLYGALAENAGPAYNIGEDGCVALPQQTLAACFDQAGVHFGTSAGIEPVALRLLSYGRAGGMAAVSPVRPAFHGNRAIYPHGPLTEWWRVLPMGFEQDFTITKRPAGHGKLLLVLAADDEPVHRGGEALGWDKLRYGKLAVTDVTGEVVPATLKSDGDRILIAVNDVRAVYPLTVDPLVWLAQEVALNADVGFNGAVAVAGDTAAIGLPNATVGSNLYQGKALVFTRTNGVWSQTAELVADDGHSADQFGYAVAIAGNVVMIACESAYSENNANKGAVYVYTYSDGTWTQTQKFTTEDDISYFGTALAFNGMTAVVGASHATVGSNANQGAAYVFTRSGGTWTQAGKLTSSDGKAYDHFGVAVDLSGTRAIVGARYAGAGQVGQAYIFAESGGAWNQTSILAANDGASHDQFGWSVALDGSTAVVGAEHATVNGNTWQGAAYVFSESNGAWTQAAKLTASDGTGQSYFGYSVALDGALAIIGARSANGAGGVPQGAAYLFRRANGSWSQANKLVASDGEEDDNFGASVALSRPTALVLAMGRSAAYFYGQSDLGLALSAPQSVAQGEQYVSQTIATNNASTASPAVSATITVPAATSFVSATATQGSCSEASGMVTCDFGQIPGNAGMATANVTLKAVGSPGTTIENTASIANATPALTASAPTTIGEGGACPAGYTEFDGHLGAGESFTSDPITVTEAGQKYVDLTAPASFAFFAITNTSYGQHTYVYPHAKHGHRWGAAGTYQVGVQAGPDAGGDYTLCVNLNPAQ